MQRILGVAGFKSVSLEPVDLQLDIGSGKGLDEAVANSREIGPASRALKGQSPEIIAKAEASLRAALTPLVQDGKVLLGAAIWIVTTRNG